MAIFGVFNKYCIAAVIFYHSFKLFYLSVYSLTRLPVVGYVVDQKTIANGHEVWILNGLPVQPRTTYTHIHILACSWHKQTHGHEANIHNYTQTINRAHDQIAVKIAENHATPFSLQICTKQL